MNTDILKNYYEKDSERFWDPTKGFTGRDIDIYPMFNGLEGTLLEYGCGSGSLLLGLAREDRFKQCYGIDISENAIKKISDHLISEEYNYKNKIKLASPQSDKLPFIKNKEFNVIVSVATIEHVLDPYTILDELYRIAKDDATLICSVPNYAYIKHRIHLLLGMQPRTGTDMPVETWREEGWDGMHLHTFTKSSFETLLKDCGWYPSKWLGCGNRFNSLGLGFLRRNFPGLWSGELIVSCHKNK